MQLKIWQKAIRLKTLPLASGGIMLGSFLAAYEYSFSVKIFIFSLLTAVFLQILSNLSNDYGDFKKGTDNTANRTDRALSSGQVTEKSMKNAIIFMSVASFLTGIILLVLSFKKIDSNFIIWLTIGLTAIVASIKYTVGKNAYGYKGWGDFFVLVFFGYVSVVGSYYLMSGRLHSLVLLPSTAFGLLCVAVLNINNLRDIDSDKITGKKTIAVILGYKNALIYQYSLLFTAILIFIYFSKITQTEFDYIVPPIAAIFYYFALKKISKPTAATKDYNQALKNVSLINLILVIVLGIFWIM